MNILASCGKLPRQLFSNRAGQKITIEPGIRLAHSLANVTYVT